MLKPVKDKQKTQLPYPLFTCGSQNMLLYKQKSIRQDMVPMFMQERGVINGLHG
ncbi:MULTISPECIES: hypothetical protein [unclassified Paenibacillus]|uniref:hypothetical protein n=1 Tax=unclassified Paenibacillus TaxID=185978 RepID=UPI000A8A402B|nr:hypothetical protein [Paenibacillus sp. FSL R5-192]